MRNTYDSPKSVGFSQNSKVLPGSRGEDENICRMLATASCPCLQTEQLNTLFPLVDGALKMSFQAALSPNASQCVGCHGVRLPAMHGANASNALVVSYPPDYGSGSCQAWDSGLEPFCHGSSPPIWCRESVW